MLLNITKQGSVARPVTVQYFTLAGQAKGVLYNYCRPFALYFVALYRIAPLSLSKVIFSFTDNEDFVPVQPTAVILHEDVAFATVPVELVNDEVVERSEVLFVRLALAPTNNTISGIQLAADTASIIITDEDGKLLRILIGIGSS